MIHRMSSPCVSLPRYGTNDDEGAGGGRWMDNLPMQTPPHEKRKDGSLLAAWVSNCHARNSYPDRVELYVSQRRLC